MARTALAVHAVIVWNQTGYNGNGSRYFFKTFERITGKSEVCILHGQVCVLRSAARPIIIGWRQLGVRLQ
jgi:hypothetical protein